MDTSEKEISKSVSCFRSDKMANDSAERMEHQMAGSKTTGDSILWQMNLYSILIWTELLICGTPKTRIS